MRNLEIVEILKTPELPDVPEEEIAGWDSSEEGDRVEENLEKLRQHFKAKANEEWWPSVRRPSEIVLEPLESTAILPIPEIPLEIDPMQDSAFFRKVNPQVEPESPSSSWVRKLHSCSDAITMGISMSEF